MLVIHKGIIMCNINIEFSDSPSGHCTEVEAPSKLKSTRIQPSKIYNCIPRKRKLMYLVLTLVY